MCVEDASLRKGGKVVAGTEGGLTRVLVGRVLFGLKWRARPPGLGNGPFLWGRISLQGPSVRLGLSPVAPRQSSLLEVGTVGLACPGTLPCWTLQSADYLLAN